MLKGKSMLILTQLGVFDVDTNIIWCRDEFNLLQIHSTYCILFENAHQHYFNTRNV